MSFQAEPTRPADQIAVQWVTARETRDVIEEAAPAEVTSYSLFTGAGSADNIRMYKKAGYSLRGPAPGTPGAVAMTKFQRVYEAAVLKTLGANTRTIAKMILFEYGMLGSLAGVVGSLGAYPTFGFHVAGNGGRLVTAPYRDDREDLEALLALAGTERPRLVFLANPDNPMGSWWDGDAVEAFAGALVRVHRDPVGVRPHADRLQAEAVGAGLPAGRHEQPVTAELAAVVEGEIWCQVLSTDADGMVSEAREIRSWAGDIIVKLPMSLAALTAATRLSREGVRTNMTLVYSVPKPCWPRRRALNGSARTRAGSTTPANQASTGSLT